MYNVKSPLDDVRLFEPGVTVDNFKTMLRHFPLSQFKYLSEEKFRFYRTTFWYPLNREPENIFELVIRNLQTKVAPPANVIGIEWWFSVLSTNKTPQWLLDCHFDRNELTQNAFGKVKHPEYSSVLFFNAVPYGELVLTDQILTEKGIRPRQPESMRFIEPKENMYVVFPGHLYHGVIGRMWRPFRDTELRISLAVNYWSEKLNVPYLRDSRNCIDTFRLNKLQQT